MPELQAQNRPSKSVLRGLYKTKSDEAISLMFGCSESAVQKWRRAFGIKGIIRQGGSIHGSRRVYQRPSRRRLAALTTKNTDREIAAMYGCSRRLVQKWRTSHGLTKSTVIARRRPWAYDLDEGFFRTVNTEKKAYILGLLATDGCVCHNGSHANRMFLSLQARDEHILREVLDAMRSDSPIHDRPKGNFPGSGPMKYIALTSKRLVADLAKLGIMPRKSLTLRYATVEPRLERHYIRGLFDGDGCFHAKAGFYFLGTEAMIDGIISTVQQQTGIRLEKRRSGRLYRANGSKSKSQVLHWMYRRATIFLTRKRDAYEGHWT